MSKSKSTIFSSRNHIKTTEPKIHVIRGKKVILDRDLAGLYGVKTTALNQAVSKNPEKFPSDFMFRLNREETRNLFHNEIPKKRPRDLFAFTAPGVVTLSTVLNTKQAIAMNIYVIRAVIELRKNNPKNRDLSIFNDLGL